MSQRGCVSSDLLATAVIDSLDFARSGGRYEADVPVAGLPRLRDLTLDGKGRLNCRVVGEQDSDGGASLIVYITGELNLRCQRCLAVLPWQIRVENRLHLVPPGDEWPDEDLVDDGSDAIAADKALALLPFIEDEVILALPLSPRHEDCELPAAGVDVNGDRSPFAALVKLKQS
jgi:uncharacterized protein